MDDFAVFVFVCLGPVVTLVGLTAAILTATANGRRRAETAQLREELDQLLRQHRQLTQQVARLEARPVPAMPVTQAAAVAAPVRAEAALAGPPSEARDALSVATDATLVGVPLAAPDALGVADVAYRADVAHGADVAEAATEGGVLPFHAAAAERAAVEAAAAEAAAAPAFAEAAGAPEPASPDDAAAQAPGATGPVPPAGAPPGSPPRPVGPPPRKEPGLEEWLGVRGIALLGALTLVVAGIYFFRYSVEHGLITPAMRVILGVVTGLACIGASERPLRARHPLLANFIAGAGVAILYLASWASGAMYELVPRPAAFALMGVTTAACCALAIRYKALSIAMIGLLGGFITPISLSTGQDRPLALFGYLLLLDVALLAVAQRTRWGVLALLSVLGTFVYQVGWVLDRMGPERVWLGVAIVVSFAVVFAIASMQVERKVAAEGRAPTDLERLVTKATQVLAILLPFLFPLFFAGQPELRLDVVPMLVLVTALTVGAGVMALSTRSYWLQLAAAAAGGVTLMVHVLASHRDPLGWLTAGLALAVAVAHYAVVERWGFLRRRSEREVSSPGAGNADSPGFDFHPAHAFLLFVVAALFAVLLAAERMLPGAAALTTLVLVLGATRVSAIGTLRFMGVLVAPLATFVMVVIHVAQGHHAGGPSELLWLALCLVPTVASQGGALLGASDTRRFLDHGAGLAVVVFAAHLVFLPTAVPSTPWLYALAAASALVLVALPLARSGIGAYFGPVLLMLASEAAMVGGRNAASAAPTSWLVCLVTIAASATLLPMLVLGERARRAPGLYRGAALAMPLFFPAILEAYQVIFGAATDGVPAMLAGVVVLLSLAIAKQRAPASVRVSAIAWPAAAALGFITVAIPLQLENEWVTVGWALMGAALLLLFRRVDHAGLKYFALLHFGAVAIRLLMNPYVLEYHPVSTWPFLNWLAYTYLVPTAAALAGFAWLRDIEIPRRRSSEAALMPANVALFANALGVLAVVLGFAWINLTIIDAFSPDGPLEIELDRQPARDLSLSLAWALYGAVLLGIGMWRKSTALRGLSLGLVMLTIAKVFLADLGNLQDLYRVASLVGLAISLIVISLAYRRFVFPSSDTDAQEGGQP